MAAHQGPPWDFPGKNIGVGCHFLLQCVKVKSESEVFQSCPTLSDPMDCSLPGSSIHGIFQARVLEWVAIAFSTSAMHEPLKKKKKKSLPLILSEGTQGCLLVKNHFVARKTKTFKCRESKDHDDVSREQKKSWMLKTWIYLLGLLWISSLTCSILFPSSASFGH